MRRKQRAISIRRPFFPFAFHQNLFTECPFCVVNTHFPLAFYPRKWYITAKIYITKGVDKEPNSVKKITTSGE